MKFWKGCAKMFPGKDETIKIMNEAEELNPGPWINHSLFTAKAAMFISELHSELDPEKSFVLGYLHDIGRREGVSSMRHTIDGYNFLKDLGYDEAAKICLTHSFPLKNVDAVFGRWDCSKEEYNKVKAFLNEVDYTIYDKLIQLCDALALPSGFCLLEKRMVDVLLRHGVNKFVVQKWKETFKIKKEIENKIGKSIYAVLPNVRNTTFEIDL